MKYYSLLILICLTAITACKKDNEREQSKATVATTNVTAITANTATSGGSITDDGGSPISQRGVVWATHTEPTLTDSIVTDMSGAATWFSNLTKLNPNTTYYVRAYATNASGTAYGNEVNFKTAAGLATVTTAAITENVALSAKSGGEVLNDGGTPVTARGVVYATTPNPTTDNFKIESGNGTGSFTVTIPTASEITYYVRAFATNSAGTAYGEELLFKAVNSNSVMDIDGNVYQTVTVGTQIWFASNLKVSKYGNGDPITDGSAASFDWLATQNARTGGFTYPDRNRDNNSVFGKYYNVYAVRDNRQICPTGWHVPTDDEWKLLEVFLGMSQADADLRRWRGQIAPALAEGGSSGLNLQNSGYLLVSLQDSYLYFNTSGYFWTSTPLETSLFNWYRALNVVGGGLPENVYRNYVQDYVMSVRCIKD